MDQLDVEGLDRGKGYLSSLKLANGTFKGRYIYVFIKENVASPLYLVGPIIRATRTRRRKWDTWDHGIARSSRESSLRIGERQRTDPRASRAIVEFATRTRGPVPIWAFGSEYATRTS